MKEVNHNVTYKQFIHIARCLDPCLFLQRTSQKHETKKHDLHAKRLNTHMRSLYTHERKKYEQDNKRHIL